MPEEFSHTNARLLAFISTGSVMKLNNVVVANKTIPANSSCGNVFTSIIPANNTQAMMDEAKFTTGTKALRSEEHTSELQSRQYLVCRLLLEKKKKIRVKNRK